MTARSACTRSSCSRRRQTPPSSPGRPTASWATINGFGTSWSGLGDRLPRTEGTQKLKRCAVQEWAEQGAAQVAPKTNTGDPTVVSILERVAGGTLSRDTRLDELGLTSLERVELLMVLENELDATVDESAVSGAATVANLEALVASPAAASRTPEPLFPLPRWNQSLIVRAIRRLCLGLGLLPLTRLFACDPGTRSRAPGLQSRRSGCVARPTTKASWTPR